MLSSPPTGIAAKPVVACFHWTVPLGTRLPFPRVPRVPIPVTASDCSTCPPTSRDSFVPGGEVPSRPEVLAGHKGPSDYAREFVCLKRDSGPQTAGAYRP